MRDTAHYRIFYRKLSKSQQEQYDQCSTNQQKDWYISHLELGGNEEVTTTEYYEVITPSWLSNVKTLKVQIDNRTNLLITLDEAKVRLQQWGGSNTKDMSAEDTDYWIKQTAACTIEKVIEIREKIEI